MQKLIELDYSYDKFEKVIDEETMQIHHSRHLNAYVTNYNAAVKGTKFETMELIDVLKNIDSVDQSIKNAINNNGGAIINHNLYFTQFENGVELKDGKLKSAVISSFGSLESMIEEVKKAGVTRFGSGWSWLVLKDGKLEVINTLNQDSPYSIGAIPLLAIDVWEHAYYLKYQNKRPEYLENILSIIDWNVIEKRYLEALEK